MAPNGQSVLPSQARRMDRIQKPQRLSMESLQRTISDILLPGPSKETIIDTKQMPTISEVEDAKCECCGISEEYTPEYIKQVWDKFLGKFVCGLCAEAVLQEMDKNGGKREEALTEHMNACLSFNKFWRAYPVLHQAEAMRKILKKSCSTSVRSKSMSPRDRGGFQTKVGKGLTRSSSCIPAITKQEVSEPGGDG